MAIMRRIRGLALLAAAGLVVAACSAQAGNPSGASQQGEPSGGQSAQAANPPAPDAVDIVRDPTDLPPPIRRTEPQKVVVELETVEVTGHLADGTTYRYWTFGGKVPGPMIRVRQGDTVEIHLKNRADSSMAHSIDLHAVNGPGGGAVATQVKAGEEKVFTFKALNPGVYVYHCATPHIPTHIAQGMYGLIVVEPEEGLPPVDREFYVMQGEFYTAGDRGAKGHLAFDSDRLFQEHPNFVVFNGMKAGLTGERAMKARVGERIRIFVGNGGPNLPSYFHIIGEVFDVVHPEGATEGLHNVQTTTIPPRGATWVEFTVDVPGRYILVDHAISRALDKGAVAYLEVEGEPNPEIFHAPEMSSEGH